MSERPSAWLSKTVLAIVGLSSLSFRACGPQNLMKFTQSKIVTVRSGEVASTLENLRL